MSRRIAAILYVVPGLGFGISALLILAYHDRRGELPMTPFGWRLMGSTAPGMGTDQLTSLGGTLAWVLIAVSAIDVATGRWLWQDRRRGGLVGLATTPVSLGLGLMFQLPFLLAILPLRVVLVVAHVRRSSGLERE
jgi:hypothetical protein